MAQQPSGVEQPAVRRRSSYVKKNIPTGRKPENYVRFQLRKNSKGYDRLELSIGRAVWYAVGRPERVALEWRGEQIVIVPDEDGWKLHIREYASPRCWLPADIVIRPGRYAATVENNEILIGQLEERK